jgi:hypothetical protein
MLKTLSAVPPPSPPHGRQRDVCFTSNYQQQSAVHCTCMTRMLSAAAAPTQGAWDSACTTGLSSSPKKCLGAAVATACLLSIELARTLLAGVGRLVSDV